MTTVTLTHERTRRMGEVRTRRIPPCWQADRSRRLIKGALVKKVGVTRSRRRTCVKIHKALDQVVKQAHKVEQSHKNEEDCWEGPNWLE